MKRKREVLRWIGRNIERVLIPIRRMYSGDHRMRERREEPMSHGSPSHRMEGLRPAHVRDRIGPRSLPFDALEPEPQQTPMPFHIQILEERS